MIRLTKQSDYGVVLMTRLACEPERFFNASELAAQTHIPPSIVMKVLKLLTGAGLLVSHRGVKGGYGLAYPPAQISIAQIIRALEGPIALTECVERPGSCGLEPSCPLRNPWQHINQAVHQLLADISLAQILHPRPQIAPVSNPVAYPIYPMHT
ncbi:SUF system Fe-S cluster assembly regulator [Anthocerotibacter panamensis]|uniref:SUF system Fe-S cluster assembly regulator n=1 Tax=Anthocerotibacter panamensis TaxID=2857077 RepID=UPI001C405527|nr:SUF system Fe-S cluster assembly regulator [Anthocerotibacter panamensis]